MIVLDDYIIEAPTYSEVKVLPGREGSSGRDRIAKIVSRCFLRFFTAFTSFLLFIASRREAKVEDDLTDTSKL